jgi:type VI secretion system secreted protein Hcp
MATDFYLQIDGIKGESTDSAHKDWIEATDIRMEFLQPPSATVHSAGGATTGRGRHEDAIVTKPIDLASVKIWDACSSGKAIKKVVLECMRASAPAVKYLLVEWDQVIVSKVEILVDEVTKFPVERVSFNYGIVKWTYTQQKRTDGTQGGNVAAGWDLTQNKEAS